MSNRTWVEYKSSNYKYKDSSSYLTISNYYNSASKLAKLIFSSTSYTLDNQQSIDNMAGFIPPLSNLYIGKISYNSKSDAIYLYTSGLMSYGLNCLTTIVQSEFLYSYSG